MSGITIGNSPIQSGHFALYAHLHLCTGKLNPTLLLIQTIDCNCIGRLNIFPPERTCS